MSPMSVRTMTIVKLANAIYVMLYVMLSSWNKQYNNNINIIMFLLQVYRENVNICLLTCQTLNSPCIENTKSLCACPEGTVQDPNVSITAVCDVGH